LTLIKNEIVPGIQDWVWSTFMTAKRKLEGVNKSLFNYLRLDSHV